MSVRWLGFAFAFLVRALNGVGRQTHYVTLYSVIHVVYSADE